MAVAVAVTVEAQKTPEHYAYIGTLLIQVISEDRKALKRYVYNGFDDFGFGSVCL